jgi:hypothetical protein
MTTTITTPMTRPKRFLTRMALFLVAVAIAIVALIGPIQTAFIANPVLNGLILGVLLAGIIYTFRQVFMLRPEVEWIDTFRRSEPGLSMQRAPVLLAPMASMLGERKGRVTLSALAMRSLLDSISSRLDESRDISRYLIGLLIFLGLLGTFWGLLDTISSVGQTIKDLSIEGGDFNEVFANLKSGLQRPLSGMGTAFSSSLFGLAGSLVLGFLDLQASQAQNRFYMDLEEWLSTVTRLTGGGGGTGEVDQSVPAYVQALLEQSADSLDNLQRTIARSEDSRASSNNALLQLSEKLATLTDQMRTEQDLMRRLAESQSEIKPILQRIAAASEDDGGGMDQASRNHLRNIDVYLLRMLEELSEGRNTMTQEIRSEIKLLARTIAAVAEDRRAVEDRRPAQ